MKFIADQTAQKLRGGYYTPLDLASFIARWVSDLKPEKVLEPSCGDGAFFQAMSDVGGFENAALTGFELDDEEAGKAARILADGADDLFTVAAAEYRLLPAFLRAAVQLVFDAGLGRLDRLLPLRGKFGVPVSLVLKCLHRTVPAAGAGTSSAGGADEDAVAGELCEENFLAAVGQSHCRAARIRNRCMDYDAN